MSNRKHASNKSAKFIDDSALDDSPPPKKVGRKQKAIDDDEPEFMDDENEQPTREDVAFIDNKEQHDGDDNSQSVVDQVRQRKALMQMDQQ